MVEISEERPASEELAALYDSVGWTAYSRDPSGLAKAIENSTYAVFARESGRLVGLARGLSDDVSIFYLQDLLVEPDLQRRGVGRLLLDRCLDRFDHVRQRVLLTDDEPHQHRLYRAAGFRDLAATADEPLHAFVSVRSG